MTDAAPRAPLWLRLVRHPAVRLAVLGTLMFFAMGYSNNFMGQLAGTPLLALAAAAGMVVLGLAVYAGYVRWVEGRPVTELALAPAGRELATGLAIGAMMQALCIGVLMVLGIYRIEGLNPVSFMLPAVAAALSAGFLEELLFRGVLFRIVEEWLGSWISVVISSLVFGLLHLANPAATLLGALFISVEAGLLLAAAYMLTRRMWLGIGFHMGWNYTQSGVFSGIVSGGEAAPGLIRNTIDGPQLLTGGTFGVEASVIAFGVCTTAGLIVLLMAIRRGHVVPPPWKRSREVARSDLQQAGTAA